MDPVYYQRGAGTDPEILAVIGDTVNVGTRIGERGDERAVSVITVYPIAV
jgi:hypothetical protein